MAMSNGAPEGAKNAVVSVVQGAGDVLNASRTAVTDIVVSTLKDAGEITGTAVVVAGRGHRVSGSLARLVVPIGCSAA